MLTSLRSITGQSISLSDSLTGIKSALRALTESSAITSAISYVTPTTVRRLYDKGRLFDLHIFDNAVFDILLKTNEITDSVTRTYPPTRDITESTISTTDNVTERLVGLIRNISESISLTDPIARVLTSLRSTTESISLNDSVARMMAALRAYQ